MTDQEKSDTISLGELIESIDRIMNDKLVQFLLSKGHEICEVKIYNAYLDNGFGILERVYEPR